MHVHAKHMMGDENAIKYRSPRLEAMFYPHLPAKYVALEFVQFCALAAPGLRVRPRVWRNNKAEKDAQSREDLAHLHSAHCSHNISMMSA
jgi:hypothetical protein